MFGKNPKLTKEEIQELINRENKKREELDNNENKKFHITKTRPRITKTEKREIIEQEIERRERERLARETAQKEQDRKRALIICACAIGLLFIVGLGANIGNRGITSDEGNAVEESVIISPVATEKPNQEATNSKPSSPSTSTPKPTESPTGTIKRATDSAMDIITRYNSSNPPQIIQGLKNEDLGWFTKTTASYGQFKIEFSESDGWPCYLLTSDMPYDEANTQLFLEESARFLHALYPDATGQQIDNVISRFSKGETHITDLVAGDLISYRASETLFDGYYYSVFVSDYIG